MVYYIRFLKVPKLHRSTLVIECTITITTDLGDAFYPDDLIVNTRLEAYGPSSLLPMTTHTKWKAGVRALPLAVPLRRRDSATLLRLCVSSVDPGALAEPLNPDAIPEIVPAWSATFTVPNKPEAAKLMQRRFDIGLDQQRQLVVWEETGERIARHLWDAGIGLVVCLNDLVRKPSRGDAWVSEALSALLDPRRGQMLSVIELGCGCGMVGIALAQLRPRTYVRLTDLGEERDLALQNAHMARVAADSSVQVISLDWDQPIAPYDQQLDFDLVLVSDCTYNSDSLPALVRTMTALQSSSKTLRVLVSMKVRHQSEAVFFKLMAGAGFVEVAHSRIPLPDRVRSEREQPLDVIELYEFSR
ncbi:hypothetical protein MMC19_000766 [Ptychographa xylographoides]|nr:hypothetical protein [Ptychographa xylographoides]